MKRILLLVMAITMIFTGTVFAGAANDFLNKKVDQIGVVIIGNSDYKTDDYYNYISELLNNENDKRYKIVCGSEVQSKYQNYWLDKGFLEEQKPQKNDLFDFYKTSGYDKILYILVSDPVVDKHNIRTGLFSSVEQSRASVTVNSFLVNNNTILKAYSVTKEDDSRASELRAKRGAFRKVLKELSVVMIPLFK